MGVMTIWDKLKSKPKQAQMYKFASDSFIEDFRKTAADLGCTTMQIKEALDQLETAYHARTNDTSTSNS